MLLCRSPFVTTVAAARFECLFLIGHLAPTRGVGPSHMSASANLLRTPPLSIDTRDANTSSSLIVLLPTVEGNEDNGIGPDSYAFDLGIELFMCSALWVRQDYARIYN